MAVSLQEPLRIMAIVGTRPEAIKMAPLCLAIQADERFELEVLSTGQHDSLLNVVLNEFNLKPGHDLKSFENGQDLAQLTAKILSGVSRRLKESKPDVVLVHGDTTSALAGALAAFYFRFPIGHIEAGLRTQDTQSPFPEEANRQLIARLATFHFAPDEFALKNLQREGVQSQRIFVVGNTVVDSLALAMSLSKGNREKTTLVRNLEGLTVSVGATTNYVLLTFHRRENLEKLREILNGVLSVAKELHTLQFVFPVHPNPLVRKISMEILGSLENITLLEPVPYFDFVGLLAGAALVVTDSGGIQEEAISLGIPVLVAREHSERLDGVSSQVAGLTELTQEAIFASMMSMVNVADLKERKPSKRFGDGNASSKIVEILASQVSIIKELKST